MANEITKVTDKNNVDHPLRDAAAQTALTGILNGQNIDSFGDVESALEGTFPRSEQAVLGAWNLMHFPYISDTDGLSNITLNVDDDGIITFSGSTGENNGQYYLSNRKKYDFQLPKGHYYLSGGISSDVYLSVAVNNVTGDQSQGATTIGSDTGSGLEFTLDKLSDIQVILQIKNNHNYNSTTVKPQIAVKADTPYAPYAKTNRELTEDVAEISALAPKETTNTASQAYAIGEHFYKNGKFCTAKAAIAQGASFTLGTNYVEGTIADILNEIDIPFTVGSDFELSTGVNRITKLVGDFYIISLNIKVKNNISASSNSIILSFNDTSVRFEPFSYLTMNNNGERLNIMHGGQNYNIYAWTYDSLTADKWFICYVIAKRTA
jgi:hypothetical protein